MTLSRRGRAASGGLGSYATQMALNGGATPVCVVSSEDKADICRSMGAELIIDTSCPDERCTAWYFGDLEQ